MSHYKKLKDTWITKEEYYNITGQFGGTPNLGQVYPAYAIGYDYPLVDSLGTEDCDNPIYTGTCATCPRKGGPVPNIPGVT